MRYWNDQPELYDEIVTNALPEPWKSKVQNEEITLDDIPNDIRFKAAIEGEQDYWGDLTDQIHERFKERLYEVSNERKG